MNGIYDNPLYYDIAFTWDVSGEIDFFRRLFTELVPFEVKRILEPACGPGRLSLALARYGYQVLGYDTNPWMVEYAGKHIDATGLDGLAQVVEGDMRSFEPPGSFGAAFNVINSLGYLHTDDDIKAHFERTGNALKTGGLYVVQLSCAWREPPENDLSTWIFERDGVRVRTTWTVEREDPAHRLSHQRCRMEIESDGTRTVLDEPHVLRLWYFDELVELAREGGLLLTGIYDEEFHQTPMDIEVTGELGNQYFVFQRR